MRKIIQIAAAQDILFALCDDGTLWRIYKDRDVGWMQISDLPPPPKTDTAVKWTYEKPWS